MLNHDAVDRATLPPAGGPVRGACRGPSTGPAAAGRAADEPAPGGVRGAPGGPLVPDVISAEQLDLADRINEAHGLFVEGCRRTVGHAVELGRLLLEAKGRVGHGRFQAW